MKQVSAKQACLVAVLALACTGVAQAQQRGVRPVVGLGITDGGDTLASVTYTNGTTDSVKGGGTVHLYGGLEFDLAPRVSLQANIGYHVSRTNPFSNGSLSFTRYPIELLGHLWISDQFRVGGGVRLIGSASVDGSGVLSGMQADFNGTTGAVFEGEYLITRQMGLKLRAVSEKYTPSTGGPSADGSHIGAYFSFYF